MYGTDENKTELAFTIPFKYTLNCLHIYIFTEKTGIFDKFW